MSRTRLLTFTSRRPKVRHDRWHVGMRTSHTVSIGFNCTDEENTESLNILQRRGWSALRSKVEEQTSDPNILSKLRSTFEERFRYDDHGIPRVWKPQDDIDATFRKARDQVSTSLFALRSLLIFSIQDSGTRPVVFTNSAPRFITGILPSIRY